MVGCRGGEVGRGSRVRDETTCLDCLDVFLLLVFFPAARDQESSVVCVCEFVFVRNSFTTTIVHLRSKQDAYWTDRDSSQTETTPTC